jgi:hypothetical protein
MAAATTNNSRRIIAFTGQAESGKDTAFEAFPEAARYSFADPLKEAAMRLFNLSYYHVYIAKDVPLEQLGGKTPRDILKSLGDVLLDKYGKDFFVNNLSHRLKDATEDFIVITDARYDPEAEMVKTKMAGTVVRIKRVKTDKDPSKGHKSEKGISEHLIDNTLTNDGTIDEFHQALRDLFPRTIHKEEDYTIEHRIFLSVLLLITFICSMVASPAFLFGFSMMSILFAAFGTLFLAGKL